MTPSKFLILCQLFYPELISSGQTVTELAEALTEQGCAISVLCGPPTLTDQVHPVPRFLTYKGIQIERIWSTRFPKINLIGKALNHLSFTLSMSYTLLKKRPKLPILVFTNPPILPILCGLLSSLITLDYTVVVFDVYPDTPVQCGLLKEKAWFTQLWRRLNQIAYDRSKSIIVLGRCMKERLLPHLNIQNRHKIIVIPIWSDDIFIQKHRVPKLESPFIKRWKLENKFILLYSGNMGLFHDMETLVETANLLQDHPNIQFLFVGEGGKKAKIQTYAKTHHLHNCQFHSYVSKEELPLLLSCADIGLVTLEEGQEGLSVPSKTFGLLAAGLPVIALMSKQSEIARILEEENCGIVIQPKQAHRLKEVILNLMEEKEKRRQMGLNGQRVIQTQINLKNSAQLYRQTLEPTS